MTIVALVPNSTIAGDSHTAVIDGDDATYAYIRRASYTQYGLSSVAMPAGSVVKGSLVRARFANAGIGGGGGSVGDPITAYVSLRDSSGAGYESWAFTISSGTPAGIQTSGTPLNAAHTFGQAQLDDLQVWFWHVTPPYGGLGDAGEYLSKMIELFVDVAYCAPPVVTVGGPSGTILTASPTLTWTFAGDPDSDGAGMQQHYRVKVFTAAQYTAPGFSPDDVAYQDTYDVVSGGWYTTIGPFANAVTYKAYVAAAQHVNGVPHWSAWAAGPAFTINTDPPYVASIVAGTAVDGGIPVTVTRDTTHENWTHVQLERSAVDQLSWTPVRGALEAPAYGDIVSFTDYEQPDGVDLWYRARGLIASGVTVTAQGPWLMTSVPVIWSLAECGEYLRAPGDPAGAVVIEVLADEATMTTEHRVGLLDVIGRAAPIAVWDTPSLPTGTLSTVTRTYDDGVALRDLIRNAPVLLWQGRRAWGHPYRWLAVTAHTVSRQPTADPGWTDYRLWEITYVEVDAPPVLS